ncbi:MAG: [Fe-Fe] hydrogenase large subunit C-terminal domain-containing protein [Candidatus Eremiobacteraeota bacterium]|nr:[Fe-Fe] hydrogenase large subunit C-terminal domain-containing protein [Candidatus Eremiobacteraeota bacterium]
MTSPEFHYSHQIISNRCKGRLDCLRACPTKALRYRNGKIVFLEKFCIYCGICLHSCKEKVFIPDLNVLEDSKAFEYKIVIPSPVLYTQFGENVHPLLIHEALKRIGFNEVVDIFKMNNEVDLALKLHLETYRGPRPIISIYCPAVVRFVQVSYPNLIEHLSKFDVPMELLAREVKKQYSAKLAIPPERIGIAFISPCLAKAVSIKQPAGADHSWFDITISIRDVYNLLLPEILEIQKEKKFMPPHDYYFGEDSSFFNHVTLFEEQEKCLYVTGLDNIKKIFEDIENGELMNILYLEPMACLLGCVNGVLCVQNPYIASHNSLQLSHRFSMGYAFNERRIKENLRRGHYFHERPVLPRSTRPEEHDISISIKRMRQKERIYMKLPHKNCGLCGSPDCETFAEDCAYGEQDLSECIFFKMNLTGRSEPCGMSGQ